MCRELGIGIVAYSPLGRGYPGALTLNDLAPRDWRRSQPRFQEAAMKRNAALLDKASWPGVLLAAISNRALFGFVHSQ